MTLRKHEKFMFFLGSFLNIGIYWEVYANHRHWQIAIIGSL